MTLWASKMRWALTLVVVLLGARGNAVTSEDYRKLNVAYQQALDGAKAASDARRVQTEQAAVAALLRMGESFKSSGNVGFFGEARYFVKRIRMGSLHTVNPDTMKCAELRAFHAKLMAALDGVENEELDKRYRVQKVMVAQLEGMARDLDAAGEGAAAELARARQKEIQEEPAYLASRQAEMLRPSPPVYQPRRVAVVPTPTPPPIMSTAKPMLELDMVKRNVGTLAGRGDYDDQLQKIGFTVQLRSRELVKTYGKLRVDVWGFGRSVTRKGSYKMLIVDTVEVPGLDRGKSVEMVTKTVENVYDDNLSAKYGFKFYGFVLEVLEEETGRVLMTKVSPSRLEKYAAKLKEQLEDDEFSL